MAGWKLLQNIELLEMRAPNDIDVVTFFDLPAGKSQMDLQQQFPEMFPTTRDAHQKLKAVYCVDAYVEHLGKVPESFGKANKLLVQHVESQA